MLGYPYSDKYIYKNKMINIIFAFLLLSAAAKIHAQHPSTPNIIVFLVDDMGWTGISCHELNPDDPTKYKLVNGKRVSPTDAELFDSTYYETPNIAKLRQKGMRFTNAYSAYPFCGPSRASILTGKYPARLGITLNPNTYNQAERKKSLPIQHFTEPDWQTWQLLPSEETTIADALGEEYLKCSIGKLHVHDGASLGFDYLIGGTLDGLIRRNYWRNGNCIKGQLGCKKNWNLNNWDEHQLYGKPIYPNLENPAANYPEWIHNNSDYNFNGITKFIEKTYLTDALSHRALEFIDMSQNSDVNPGKKPFFLYMAHYGVHSPIQAKKQDVNYFKNNGNKIENIHQSPDYAAMTKSVDNSLGYIMARLEHHNISNNTIIIFTSDNGGMSKSELGKKMWTSNAPLRHQKSYAFEGGIRVPFIVYSNNESLVAHNSTCKESIVGTDIFPTILELAGNKTKHKDIDGESIVPLLDNDASDFLRINDPETKSDDGAIFIHSPHYFVLAPYSLIIQNGYKFMKLYETDSVLSDIKTSSGGTPCGNLYQYQLYELFDPVQLIKKYKDLNSVYKAYTNKRDYPNNYGQIYENHNLIDQMPRKATTMKNTLYNWLKYVNAEIPQGIVNNKGTKNEKDDVWYTGWDNKRKRLKNNSIQQAINESSTKDTIVIHPGVYTENLNINKDISLSSSDSITLEEWDSTVINGEVTFKSKNAKIKAVSLANYDNLWTFDNLKNQIATNSFNHHHGTIQGVTDAFQAFIKDGIINGAMSFDGINDYIEVNNYRGVISSKARSCATWIKIDTASKGGDIISWGSKTLNKQNWRLRISNELHPGSLKLQILNTFVIDTQNDLRDNQWHHVAVTFDKFEDKNDSATLQDIKLFIDGHPTKIEYYSTNSIIPGDSFAIDTASAANVEIGNYSATRDQHFEGMIDDVRLYGRALSNTEILTLYTAGRTPTECECFGDVANKQMVPNTDGLITEEDINYILLRIAPTNFSMSPVTPELSCADIANDSKELKPDGIIDLNDLIKLADILNNQPDNSGPCLTLP